MPKGYRLDGSKLGFQKGNRINLGRIISEETKKKMSEIHKGKHNDGMFPRIYKEWSFDNFNDGFINKGRFFVYSPNHPRASKYGYILRSIVAYEKYNNIQTLKDLHIKIHHIDGNPLNDSKENLKMINAKDHVLIHKRMNNCYVIRKCENCGKKFEIIKSKLTLKSYYGKFCNFNCYNLKRKSLKNTNKNLIQSIIT